MSRGCYPHSLTSPLEVQTTETWPVTHSLKGRPGEERKKGCLWPYPSSFYHQAYHSLINVSARMHFIIVIQFSHPISISSIHVLTIYLLVSINASNDIYSIPPAAIPHLESNAQYHLIPITWTLDHRGIYRTSIAHQIASQKRMMPKLFG